MLQCSTIIVPRRPAVQYMLQFRGRGSATDLVTGDLPRCSVAAATSGTSDSLKARTPFLPRSYFTFRGIRCCKAGELRALKFCRGELIGLTE